tara:strand:- start:269 stop:433 length:165 start_codon:yes stop_codon:yes gene_type:complete
MPKLRNGKITKPLKTKPKKSTDKKERTLNQMICKAEKDAVEKKKVKFTNKEIFG